MHHVIGDDQIKQYVKDSFQPEDVFDEAELETWAETHDFVKKED